MRTWLAILVTLVACKDPGIERLEAVKAKVCTCRTASCAEQEMKQVPQGTIKSTPRAQALARDMMSCLAKLQEAERPTTDPDAEGSAAEGPAAEGSAAAPPASTPPAAGSGSAAP